MPTPGPPLAGSENASLHLLLRLVCPATKGRQRHGAEGWRRGSHHHLAPVRRRSPALRCLDLLCRDLTLPDAAERGRGGTRARDGQPGRVERHESSGCGLHVPLQQHGPFRGIAGAKTGTLAVAWDGSPTQTTRNSAQKPPYFCARPLWELPLNKPQAWTRGLPRLGRTAKSPPNPITERKQDPGRFVFRHSTSAVICQTVIP